jgi:hypothetical protein
MMEYRLYYNSDGTVHTYTTEDIGGLWIKVSAEQYAEARMDIKVVDGVIQTPNKSKIVSKLYKNNVTGIKTSKYDVNILTDVDSVYWDKIEHAVER